MNLTPDLDGALWIVGLGAVLVTFVGLCTATGALDDPDYTDHDAPPAPTAAGESTP